MIWSKVWFSNMTTTKDGLQKVTTHYASDAGGPIQNWMLHFQRLNWANGNVVVNETPAESITNERALGAYRLRQRSYMATRKA
jgi:hypothetical protein